MCFDLLFFVFHSFFIFDVPTTINNLCRFDVRAELNDVSQYEPPPGGYDNRLAYLSAAEQRAEQLCEEERYYSLFNNDFEEDLYKGRGPFFFQLVRMETISHSTRRLLV